MLTLRDGQRLASVIPNDWFEREITMLQQVAAKALGGTSALALDRQGSMSVIAAVLTPLMLMFAGLSINVAHLYNVKTGMAQTLDTALTSTTRDVIVNGRSQEAATTAMTRYLDANGNAGMSEAAKIELAELNIDKAGRTVTAKIKSDVRVPFPVFGIADTWPVVVQASTSYSDRPVEVAMMLDLTASMNESGTPKDGRRQSKLDNLKDAASKAVSDLLARNVPGMQPRVRVALVPYSQGVNAGDLAKATYIEDAAARIPDAPIGLDELNLPINLLIKTVLGLLRPASDKCTTERKQVVDGQLVADLSDAAPGEAMINRDKRLAKSKCPSVAVTPLTSDQDALLRQINRFSGVGSTAGHIGVQWTRYLLSPNWSGFLRQEAGSQAVPAPYSTSQTAVRKVAILLTDGEFNTEYARGGNSASMAQAHCAAMKQNVEVFTIGFMLDDRNAKATMAACASPDQSGGIKHYYEASTAEELEAAFGAITANTEVVRLTN